MAATDTIHAMKSHIEQIDMEMKLVKHGMEGIEKRAGLLDGLFGDKLKELAELVKYASCSLYV